MLLDNKNNGHVGTELKAHADEGSKLSVLSALFTLYGFLSLKKELSKLSNVRLLLTDWPYSNLQSLIGSDNELRFINKLDQKRIAQECVKWLSGRVEVKASNGLNHSSFGVRFT